MTQIEMADWMLKAYQEAAKSPDLSTKNGAVLVSAGGHLLGQGCNRIVPECCKTPERLQRPLKYAWTTHAEVDCICDALRSQFAPLNTTMVVAWASCADCAKVIVGSGVRRVVRHRHRHMDSRPDWLDSIKVGDEMFAAAGVEVVDFTGFLGVKTLFNGEVVEV